MVLKNVTVDDRDTNAIKYQGFWFNPGTYNATSVGVSGTLASTNDPNANFTIDTPPIVAFYYFGIKRSHGGFYQICIDCDPNNRQWRDIDGVNSTDDGQNPPIALFSANWTDPHPHEIIVTNRPDTRFPNNNSQLTLDVLVYTTEDGTPAPTPAPTPPPTPSSSPPSSSSGKSHGKLVAAVASSVSVVGSLFILFIILLIRHWRRKRAAKASWNASAAESPISQPYTWNVNGDMVNPFPLSHDQSRPLPSKLQGLSFTSPDLSDQNSSFLATNDSATSEVYGRPFISRSSVPPTFNIPRREEDAGSVHGFSEYGETLPPDYEDATRSRTTRGRL